MKKVGNQGFSLVELVIVMALIVILGGFAFVGITVLTSRPVDECAKKLQVALEGNRNTTMGKFEASVEFYLDASGNIMMREVIDGTTTEKQIGQSVVGVKYKVKAPATIIVKDLTTTPLKLNFDRSSGSLKPLADGSGTVIAFVVSRGDREITVSIDTLTGRVDVQ